MPTTSLPVVVMDGDGIVAVVRGTKCAGLSVTLLPNAYFKGDTQKFNMNNDLEGQPSKPTIIFLSINVDSIYARVTQSNAQTNTERIPQNIRRYNVTYQLTNYYKPSVNYILPFPHQMTKRIHMKNFRAHPKFKKQQTYRHSRNEYNKTNDANQEVNCTINSSVNHSLTSVEATSSSQKEFTKYMYDYLKSESLVPKVDVRYFTEIKKALRNGLRRITDRNIPCPVKRSRYYQHKRYGNCSKHSLTDSVSRGTKLVKHTMSSNISKRKCFCHQPLTCECHTSKETVTTGYISPNYLNESNKKNYSKSQLKQNIFDVCAPGDFTDTKYQKIFDVLNKWVKDIPKHPNFNENDRSKLDMIIGKLAETLQEIFNTEDFLIRAKPEIVKCLNTLSMLRLDDATDKARFIEELINDLIRRFVDLAESDFVECISSEIEKITIENNSSDSMQSKINHFVDELIPIALKRPTNNESYKEILKTKLIELFKRYNLIDDVKDSDNMNVLGEKFADRLCHIYLYNFSNEGEINQDNIEERKFLDWLKDTPELSSINVKQCLKIIKSLLSKYSHYKQEDYKNKETEKKVEDDVKKCLDLIENKLHISFSTRRKEELIKQLKWLLSGIQKTVKDNDDTFLGTVMEWLLSIPGVSEQNIMKNDEEIKKYAILVKEVQTHMNNKLPNVKKVISNWLQNFLRKNNIRLDPKAYDNLINKLIHKVNDLSNPTSVDIKPRRRWDDPENRSKYSNIRNIVDVCFSDFGINVKEVTKRKMVEEILKNIADNNILWDKVLKNLILIMSKDTSLQQNTIKKLSNDIIHRVKKLFIPHKGNGRNCMTPQQHKFTSDSSHQEEPLLVNISLNSQLMDKSNKVNRKIQTQQGEKETKQAHTSEGDLKEENIQQVDISQISQNKTSANNTLDVAESEISRDFLGPNDSNNFSSTENNNDKMISMKEYYNESSSILENIKAVSNNLVEQKIEKLKKLEKNDQCHIKKVNHSTQYTEQENLSFDNNFTTSTPYDYSQKKISISNKLSIENNQIDKKDFLKRELSEHYQYLNDAKSAIYNWLKLFNIDLSSLVKNNLTEIILSDYLERQKYLQLSGITTKENDEIEQLKYQIYRQMYKLANSEMLQIVMAKVTDLYENLKNLKHYKTLEEEQISDAKLKTLSTEDFNELTQKIRLWLNSISSQFHVLSDKNGEENMIQDLSKSLYFLKKEDNYKTHGKNIITTWLQKVLNVSDINELNDLSESLMIYIENDSLRNTQIPIQDISEFLIENLKGGILDWLREIRPFPRNTMSNLPFLEDFASLLANDLKRVFENNSNIWSIDFENLLTEEIVKNFKNILSHDDNGSTFYQKLAKNLLTYIKQLRIFHSISDRLTMYTVHGKDLTNEYKYGNKIKQAIFLWSKNLALETGKSYDDIEELIRGFVEKIFTYLREDIDSIENRLKQDALKLLKIIPLKIHQERNNVLQNYIKSLINTIKGNIDLHDSVELVKEINDKIDSHAYKIKSHLISSDQEYIHDVIKNWCDILPFHVDSKQKNKEIKQNLVSQIIRFIHNLNSNDDVPKNNVYKLLHDHIKEQVKTLCTTPDLENCMDLLIDVLIERLKDTKCLNVKESIGSIYSLLLYETINKTLSLITNPSGDDQISLDLLKKKLANAFIELHNPTDNVDILSKYKDKLYNAISKFCEEYLNQSFIIPRDREKVKEDLDKALRDESIPKLNISKEISVNTNQMVVTKRHISTQCDLNVTPSILSIEDIDLLNNIRSRSRYLARSNARQDSIKIVHKDVSINPIPVDAYTQTEIQFIKNITNGITQTSRHSLNERVSLQKEISPQMVIKEYYWDTSGSNQSLRMSIVSEVSQKIDRVPSVLAQTEDFVKNNLISSNQTSKTIETDVSTKKKETVHTQTNVPTNHTKNSSQQTSNTFESITLPSTSHLEVNQNEIENFVNDEDNRIDIDPKSKRTVIPSDVIPSRHKLNLEGDGDIHIKTSKRHKHVTNDMSKMMSGNREMESYKHMFKFNKDGQNCNCKDYIFSKCRNRMNICDRQSNLKHCAKGYGCFCPYPSNVFFKKEC